MMEAVIAKAYEAKSGGKQKQQFGDKLQKLDMSEQYLLDCAYLQWPLETDSRGGKAIDIFKQYNGYFICGETFYCLLCSKSWY